MRPPPPGGGRTPRSQFPTSRSARSGGASIAHDCPEFACSTQVRSVVVLIEEVVGEESLQLSLIQHNHVIEQLSPTASHPALRRPILPRASD